MTLFFIFIIICFFYFIFSHSLKNKESFISNNSSIQNQNFLNYTKQLYDLNSSHLYIKIHDYYLDSPSTLRNTYKKYITSLNSTELKTVSYLVSLIKPYIHHFPSLSLLPFKFKKIDDRLEQGWSFTFDDTIHLSQSTIHSLKNNIPSSLKLIIHEQLHCFQKTYPESFQSFYKSCGFHQLTLSQQTLFFNTCPHIIRQSYYSNPDEPYLYYYYYQGKPYIILYLFNQQQKQPSYVCYQITFLNHHNIVMFVDDSGNFITDHSLFKLYGISYISPNELFCYYAQELIFDPMHPFVNTGFANSILTFLKTKLKKNIYLSDHKF